MSNVCTLEMLQNKTAMFAKPLFREAEAHNGAIRKTKKIYQESLLEKKGIISEFVIEMGFYSC